MQVIETSDIGVIYRGIRRDRDNVGFERPRSRELDCGFSFWAANQSYAVGFGPILLSAQLAGVATILDLSEGDVDGEELIRIAPHVAKACKVAADELVEPTQLWERVGDRADRLAEALRQDGFDALLWLETANDIAVFVANHAILQIHEEAIVY